MINHPNITWEQTEDPSACNTNRTEYMKYSRDPSRTPFQWSDAPNAGFNDGSREPWLPVNHNFRDLNLAKQLNDTKSTYHIYKNLIKLRKEAVYRFGATKVHAFEEKNVLAVLRSYEEEHFVTVINLNGGEDEVSVDLSLLSNETNSLNAAMIIYATSKYHPPHDSLFEEHEHHHEAHEIVNGKNFRLRAYDAVIVKLVYNASSTITVSIAVLFMALARFFFF